MCLNAGKPAGGGTAEDRFLGVVHAGGVSRIMIGMPDSVDWEVDHVQYGRVPEPATAGLALMGAVLVLRRRWA